MTFLSYISDRKIPLATNLLGIGMIVTYLLDKQIPFNDILKITMVWGILLFSSMYLSYRIRKNTYNRIENSLSCLDNKNLFTQIFELTKTEDDKFYNEIIQVCNLDMLNQISNIERSKKEYKEYIEQWVHEVKTPLTSIKLICDNQKTDMSYKIIKELESISNAVEQTLFYARSDSVSKDYFIKEVNLSTIISHVLIKNKQMLIQNHIAVEPLMIDTFVSTDAKWIEFIVSQIVYNSVKYRNKSMPQITFTSSTSDKTISLHITDNGMGISTADLLRVFQKGFTGANGRDGGNATGIGLYLCKKLSEKLNVHIDIQSQLATGTTVSLGFHRAT